MKFDVPYEAVVAIITQELEQAFAGIMRDLDNVISTHEPVGVFSFDYQEEVAALQEHAKALQLVMAYYGVINEQ